MDYLPKFKPKLRKKNRNSYTYKISKPNENNEKYYLGDVWIGKTNNIFPLTWNTCKGNITSNDDVDKLILHFDSVVVVITITTELQFLKDLLSVKIFNMTFKLDEENVFASLYISNLPLPKFYMRIGLLMKTVFSIIFNISSEYNEIQTIKSSSTIESFNDLYKNINNYREELPNLNVQHSCLKPTLRQYQQDAVRWMIQREQKPSENEMLHPLYEKLILKSGIEVYYDKHTGFIDINKPMTNSLIRGGILADEMGLGKTVEVLACILSHPCDSVIESCNIKSCSKDNTQLFPIIEKQSRKRKIIINKENEETRAYVDTPKKLKIPEDWVKSKSKKSALRIALEMWYNNTLTNNHDNPKISRIQCICGDDAEQNGCVECTKCSKIQHSRCLGYKSSYGTFYCPQCWVDKPLLDSRATLIVTPQSLKQQWCDEICKHICGGFKVFQYDGGVNLTPIYPTKLQQYDLVITTYNVLQTELRLTDNGQVISLRRPPKYALPGSPITRINWWRVCLDEAQTVETPGRMVSEMAKRIQAHHRWAVSGTPISKDISDLYGLIDYLQFTPYSELDTWNSLLYKPYINGRKEFMHQFLAKILWRTAKNDVIDQINIPQQTVEEHWLEFSAVEKFFYQREHELCSKELLEKLRHLDLNVLLRSVNRSVLKKVMQPLLALRQACSHHKAVRGKYLATRKQVSSMEDLLNALIAKNINENEDYLRITISSLNGLAGIYLLLQNPTQAAEEYRKVLQLSTRFVDKTDVDLAIDKLQLIHTMHNLSEILDTYPAIPPTLRDASLKEECKTLEKEYMERFTKQTFGALQDSLKYSSNIVQLQQKFRLNPGQWFADTLDWITTNSLFHEYLAKLTSIMHAANVLIKDINERKVLYMICVWDEQITQLKEECIDSIYCLFQAIEDETKIVIPTKIIEAASGCHLRPQNKSKSKKLCPVCEANLKLKQYESKIFSSTQKDDVSNSGSWKPSSEEFMLRALYALGRQRNLSADHLYDGDIHFHILDILKKEFKEIRKLWTFVDAQVCAKDEVDMCKIRLSLKEENIENESDRSKLNRIVKQLTYIKENKFETIHLLSEYEIHYQKAVLTGEFKTNSAALEKNLGTYKYLQTLHKQQTIGQTPDPCPICKNTLEKHWTILPCGHCYCIDCIQVLLAQTAGQHILCSICRSKQLIAEISYLHTDYQKQTEDELKVRGNHSTKVGAVVQLVTKLTKTEKDIKVLIFSNWKVILNVLNEVLKMNDIKSEILSLQNFCKSLDKFKDKSKGVTALLLPLHLGSKGLNLIEATHVIFVEPLLDPGDQLQAIGRIHRIGQTKPTVVHKFFMKNTIEENIYHATAANAEEWNANKVKLGHIKQLFEAEYITNFNNDVETNQISAINEEESNTSAES